MKWLWGISVGTLVIGLSLGFLNSCGKKQGRGPVIEPGSLKPTPEPGTEEEFDKLGKFQGAYNVTSGKWALFRRKPQGEPEEGLLVYFGQTELLEELPDGMTEVKNVPGLYSTFREEDAARIRAEYNKYRPCEQTRSDIQNLETLTNNIKTHGVVPGVPGKVAIKTEWGWLVNHGVQDWQYFTVMESYATVERTQLREVNAPTQHVTIDRLGGTFGGKSSRVPMWCRASRIPFTFENAEFVLVEGTDLQGRCGIISDLCMSGGKPFFNAGDQRYGQVYDREVINGTIIPSLEAYVRYPEYQALTEEHKNLLRAQPFVPIPLLNRLSSWSTDRNYLLRYLYNGTLYKGSTFFLVTVATSETLDYSRMIGLPHVTLAHFKSQNFPGRADAPEGEAETEQKGDPENDWWNNWNNTPPEKNIPMDMDRYQPLIINDGESVSPYLWATKSKGIYELCAHLLKRTKFLDPDDRAKPIPEEQNKALDDDQEQPTPEEPAEIADPPPEY